MRIAGAALLAAWLLISAPTARAATVQWEQFASIPGVFDVAGPRSDGKLVVAAATHLLLLDDRGGQADFAPDHTYANGSESYIALSTGMNVEGADCAFAIDDLFALDVSTAPPGITRISASGAVSQLATINGVSTLSGIAFDTVGRFNHRLLVIGPPETGKTSLFAIDCRGTVTTVGTVAAAMEGGIATAPEGFGSFAGDLVAPDEGSGNVYALSPTGELRTLVASGLPAGGDIGVESVGFATAGDRFTAYVADRGTPGNPHPGTDSLLRLTSDALASAGVRAGDLLVATEGGATVQQIRCAATCTAKVIATGPEVAHAEGRLLVTANGVDARAAPVPLTHDDGTSSTPWLVGVGALVVIAAVGVVFVRSRRRRPEISRAEEPR